MKVKEIKVLTIHEAGTEYELRSPMKALDFWNTEIKSASWYDPEKEMMVVLLMSIKLKIKSYNLVSLGGLNSSLVHPREIFRPAIMMAASSIILMHNHPSGDKTPSGEDITITEGIKKAGKIIGIRLLDHIIIAGDNYYSLKKAKICDFSY